MPEFLFKPVPHNEAIDFIQSKSVVSREVFDGLLPDLKARAFTITGIEQANILQRVRDIVARLPAGESWNVVQAQILKTISPYIVDPNASEEERAIQEKVAERRAELVLRMNGFMAYAAANYQVMTRNLEAFPYWRYTTVGDDKVRSTHAALHGLVIPATSPFWQTHFPPWEWNCRCQVLTVSRGEVSRLREADADRAPDERLLLEGARLRELEVNNRVVRGMNNIVNVQSAFQRGEPGAFHWHPGDLRLSVADLKARYAPDVWSAFERWAQRTPIGEGANVTVWEWLDSGAVIAPAETASVAEPVEEVTGIARPIAATKILQAVQAGNLAEENGITQLVRLGYSESEARKLIADARDYQGGQ